MDALSWHAAFDGRVSEVKFAVEEYRGSAKLANGGVLVLTQTD